MVVISWIKSWFEKVQCGNCSKVVWGKIAWKIKYKVADKTELQDFDLCPECAKVWEDIQRQVCAAQVYRQNELLKQARENAKGTGRRSVEISELNKSDEN